MKTTKILLSYILIMAALLSLAAGAYAEIDDYKDIGTGSSGQTVYNLQKRLKALGYNVGGIDGTFGSGTKQAIRDFQAQNGLEVTGIATAETQKTLYSDSAKKAFIREVEISKVSWVANTVKADFRNNTNETVDSITYHIFTHDFYGNPYTSQTDVDKAGMLGSYTDTFDPVRPGHEGTTSFTLKDGVVDQKVLYVSVCVKSFHTTSGNHYEYSPEQQLFIRNDGNAIYPVNTFAPDKMNDNDLKRADSVRFGYHYYDLPAWIASLYKMPSGGEWVSSVEKGGVFDRAGIQANDLILSFNDEPTLDGHADERAKLQLLAGNEITVRYLRNGISHTAVLTEVTEDMLAEGVSLAKLQEENTTLTTESSLLPAVFPTDEPPASSEPPILDKDTGEEAETASIDEETTESDSDISEPPDIPQPIQEIPGPESEIKSVQATPESAFVQDLSRLAELYQQGLLTEEEYSAAKAILFSGT